MQNPDIVIVGELAYLDDDFTWKVLGVSTLLNSGPLTIKAAHAKFTRITAKSSFGSVATMNPRHRGNEILLSKSLYGWEILSNFRQVKSAVISEDLVLRTLTAEVARTLLDQMGQQRFFIYREHIRSPLGALIYHHESNSKGRQFKNRVKNSDKFAFAGKVRPEILGEWLAMTGEWSDFTDHVRKYPAVAQHILSDIYVDQELPQLVRARDYARVIAAEAAARSAIDEIAAELGVM